MITRNKLSNQSDNKLSRKFRLEESGTQDFKTKRNKKKKNRRKLKTAILLLLVLALTFGATFGIVYLVYNNFFGPEQKDAKEETIVEDTNMDTESIDDEAMDENTASIQPITNANSSNSTIRYGRLMLINPNFMVERDFIANRKSELISLSKTYGIEELHSYNGDNLIDPEAGGQLNKMLSDYTIFNPGHSMKTVSCFREAGTSCGRLCMPTGASDHHTGLTCDLIDPSYGDSLDTSTYGQHPEWQWLKANSYKYGFIDRFPEAWAGGSMEEPMNVNAEGSTGLFETWHYRYVGLFAAKEIATGVYNNGQYDSLEHYLKMRGLVSNLLNN